MNGNELQKKRQAYRPVLPEILGDLHGIAWSKSQSGMSGDKMKGMFPLTGGGPLLTGQKGGNRSGKPLQIGVVLSGGQAAGGHNVITGLFDALKQLHPQSRVFGFLDGPGGIVSGKYKELTAEFIAPYRNMGGFDMIGSGRTKIETDEQLSASLATVQKMKLDGLVVIGGDDSNTNAAILAEYFLKCGSSTKVIGVPKTIDGDLKNAYVATSFGFDTACKTYSEMIGNIARDAASAKKYYHFIKLMGRSASHIALECALKTQPNLTLIGEEVAAEKKTLAQITSEIADLITKRAEKGKHYGVILIPEGLIEFIPEIGALIKELNQILANHPSADVAALLTSHSKECFASLPERIREQLLQGRDPHGNVQVSLIETERLLMETVSRELEKRQIKFSLLQHFFGYEGRAGYPSNFDCNYCYALGHAAALLIDEGATGYMCAISGLARPPAEWGIGGVPLTSLMHIEIRKGKEKPVIEKALVDLKGPAFSRFRQHRERWMSDDMYSFPGPIQFFGDPALTDSVPITIYLESHGR